MVTLIQDMAIPARRAILATLLDGPKNVSDVVRETGLKQPNVSNHFAKMRQSRTVRASRNGREIFYTLASPEIESAVRSALGPRPHEPLDADIETLSASFAEWAVQGDDAACNQIVDALIKASVSVREIFEDVLARAMSIVGAWYEKGQIDEGQEHAASAITERALDRISGAHIPRRPNGGTVLIGCAANNWHTIGVRMLADMLKLEGFRAIYLGPNVPEASFLNAVRTHRPAVVLVSTSSESVMEAWSLLAALRKEHPNLPVAVGGTGVIARPGHFDAMEVAVPGPGLSHVLQWVSAQVPTIASSAK